MRDALILVFANKQDHKDGMKSLIFTHAIMSGIGVHRKELCDVFVSEQHVITREFWVLGGRRNAISDFIWHEKLFFRLGDLRLLVLLLLLLERRLSTLSSIRACFRYSYEAAWDPGKARPNTVTRQALVRAAGVCYSRWWVTGGPDVAHGYTQRMRPGRAGGAAGRGSPHCWILSCSSGANWRPVVNHRCNCIDNNSEDRHHPV